MGRWGIRAFFLRLISRALSIALIAGGISCGKPGLKRRRGIKAFMPAYLPKTVMITGATGGFGAAFTKKFADAGGRLILTSRKPDKLDELAKPLKVPVHKIILDVRDRAAIEKAYAE